MSKRMIYDNDDYERMHLSSFLRAYSTKEYNISKNNPPEPDFTISTGNEHQIGIEHTRLYYSDDKRSNNIRSHYSVADKIIKKAHSMFKKVNDYQLTVDVDFTCSYGLAVDPIMLTNRDINELSLFIYEFVLSNLPLRGASVSFSCFDEDLNKYILPKKIFSIYIENNFECWHYSSGGTVPSIQSYDLEQTINKKNKKVANYRDKYDELWLLIVEDRNSHQTSYSFDDEVDITTSSLFDRVFIYRNAEYKVHEAVNSKPNLV